MRLKYLRKEYCGMKKFEMPEIEVVNFSVEDVITVSGETGGNKNATPWS